MKVIIDIDKKSIEVPNKIKDAYEKQVEVNKMFGKNSGSILDMFDLSDFKVVSTQTRSVSDKTNAKDIDDFMKGVKDTDKDKYNEYVRLRDNIVGKSKNGKPLKTNFLIIKKWFYENYPNQNPYKK